jgi:DNA-binding NarL/FixJ family response regulator
LPDKVQPAPTLILLVHTGDDFGFVIEQIELCKASYPNGQVAIVADRYRPDQLIAAFRAGASDCFVGVMTSDLFIKSLELVMMGEAVVPPALLSYFPAPEEGRSCDRNDGENDDADVAENDGEAMLVAEGDGRAQQLSRRERGIVRFLIEGESNKSIARKLEIAEATVKVHVKAILRKIRVRNRTQAAIWGMNNEWQLQTIDAIAPPLSPAMAKRPPNDIGPSRDIVQRDEPTLDGDQQGEPS